MHTLLILATLSMPPRFGVPSLIDAWQGWLSGIVLLVLPSLLLAYRSHFLLGHWSRFFAQWRRRSWWQVITGSIIAALGTIGLLGAIPAWEAHYRAWERAALLNSSDPTPVLWLRLTQQPLQSLLQMLAVVFLLTGVILLAVGMIQFSRHILIKRKAVAPNSEWVMIPPSA